MKKGYKQVNKKEFELTKQLGAAGVSSKKISIVTGRSRVSICKMLKADTIEEYRKLQSENSAKYRVNKSKDQMPVSVLDTDVSVNIPDLLRKIAAYLEKEKNVE